MIKAIIFDADGMVIKKGPRFSDYLEKDSVIPVVITKDFFENEFQDCLVGKADLKEELSKYIEKWGWTRTVNDLLDYWFSVGKNVDPDMISTIEKLRSEGILCYLATNQEKYRTEYFIRSEMDFGNVFDNVFSSAYIGFKKPQTEFFNHIMNSLPEGTERNEVMFWDDDEDNVKEAEQFGFQANLYTDFEDFQERVSQSI